MTGGVKDEHRQAVIDALAANERVERVVLFGSRVAEAYRASSDIDLALFGDGLTQDDVSALSAEMEALPLAQHVDLVLGDAIDDAALRAHIEADGVEWFKRSDVECRIHVFSGRGKFTSSPQMIALYPNGTSAAPLHAGVGDTEVFWSGNLASKMKGVKLPAKLPIDWGQSADTPPVKAFVVAEGHRAYLGEKPLKPGSNRIALEPIRGGGSAIFSNGEGHIPGRRAPMEVRQYGSGQIRVKTGSAITVSSDVDGFEPCEINQPLVIQDTSVRRFKFVVRAIIGDTVIVDYMWLYPRVPLPINYEDPSHKAVILRLLKDLRELTNALKEKNERPEKSDKILENLNVLKTKIETKRLIYKTDIRSAHRGLRPLVKFFYGETKIGAGAEIGKDAVVEPGATIGDRVKIGPGAKIGGHVTVEKGAKIGKGARVGVDRGMVRKIASAVFGLNSLIDIVSDYIPENIKDWVKGQVKGWVKRFLDEDEDGDEDGNEDP